MNGPRISASELLRQGVQAQQAGQLAQAEACYRQVLQRHPEQPDALQLLGLIASRVGNLPAAEDLMRRSLRARPAQPHVWNNLGNLLQDLARFDDALACYAQALTLDAKYVDAHYNQARALRSAGRLPEAQTAVRRALSHAPQPAAALLQLLAQIEDDGGNLSGALTTLDQALHLAPDRPSLLHNRATVLQRLTGKAS
jgi:tetratricopeptide (TPR) repeat protein